MKPDLMFLSLGITTFYRKSFTFESQVSVVSVPLNLILFSSQGLLTLYYFVGCLSWRLDLSCSLGLLLLGLWLLCQGVAGKVRNYDSQDVINNLMMYGALVYLDTRAASSLWLEILCLCPAQLMR